MLAPDGESIPVEFPAEPTRPESGGSTSEKIAIPVVVPSRICSQSASDEIVVCAEDPETYRLRPLPDSYREEKQGGGLGMDLGKGVRVEQSLEQASIGGTPSNRVMVRAKIKF